MTAHPYMANSVPELKQEMLDAIGADSIEELFAQIPAAHRMGLEQRFAATSHHVSNIQLTFEGPDHARATTYLYAWHRYRDGSPDSELWGRYHHRFERTAAGWRIAGLVLTAAGAKDFHRSELHPTGRR